MAEPMLAETIGFELETENLPRNRISLPRGFQATGDASIESPGTSINNIPITLPDNLENMIVSSTTLGTEILSGIIDTNEPYLPILKDLCRTLVCLGENEHSERCGFHVHLSFSKPNLNMIKSVLRLGAHLEDVFFLLGGMGYAFRGLINDAIYCRPITNFGPQVTEAGDGNYYPCFVLDDLLDTTNITEFRLKLGDLYNFGDNRYVPVRYSWLNLFNLFNSKGTLEFRVFNKSLKPIYLYTVIELCKYFGQSAISLTYTKKPLQVNSIFDWRDKKDIIKTFVNWAEEFDVPCKIIDYALEIMELTPIDSIRLPKVWVFSHLMFHSHGNRCPIHWGGTSYKPSIRVNPKAVKKPNFIDIHNLQTSSRRRRMENEDTIPTEHENLDLSSQLREVRQPIELNINWNSISDIYRNISDVGDIEIDNEDEEEE